MIKLDDAKKILEMEIHIYREEEKLYFSQKKYIEKVFECLDMQNSKLVSTCCSFHTFSSFITTK
jgi:hypothetical protein